MVETTTKTKTRGRKKSQIQNKEFAVWFKNEKYIIGIKDSEFDSIETAISYLRDHYPKTSLEQEAEGNTNHVVYWIEKNDQTIGAITYQPI